MAEVVQEHRQPYVSCIRSFGRPILPPLMTDEKRRLMRHFRTLACEREVARNKQKREVHLRTLHEAELGPRDDEGDSLEVSQLSSLLLLGGGAPPMPPSVPLGTRLGGAVSGATTDTGSSATLVPSSPNSDRKEDDADSWSSSSIALSLASEVPQVDIAGPPVEKDLVASTNVKPVTTLLTMSIVTPVTTPMTVPVATPITTPVEMPTVTSPAGEPCFSSKLCLPSLCQSPVTTLVTSVVNPVMTPMEMPTVTPVTSPVTEGCFSTKLSVPSLCRSRSFVVERPSLALLLWKERCRDGSNALDGVNVKIVGEPEKSSNRALFQENPESSGMHTAGEPADVVQSLGVSQAFVARDWSGVSSEAGMRTDDCSVGDSSGQTGHAKTSPESVQAAFAYDCSYPELYLLMGGNTGAQKETPTVPGPLEVPGKTGQAQSLLDKCSSVGPHFVSHVFKDYMGGPAQMDTFAAHETVRNIFNVPVSSSSNLTRWNGPSSFLAWNPFDGITITKNPSHTKDDAADNTLNDVPNVPKEDDSAEETAADDMFADALDDGGEEFAPASPVSFVPKSKTFPTAWSSPKSGITFVNDSYQGDCFFVPVSTSPNRHSLSSSSGSAHSSFSVEKDLAALNSSCDAEDEEQYEDADEPHDERANTPEHVSSVESAESSCHEFSASSCSRQLNYAELYVSVDDSVPMDYGHQMEVLYHTRAQECSGGHWGTLETSLLPPAALAEVVDGEDVPDTNDSAPEPRRVRSTSPTSMRGDSTVGPLSLPADLSSLSCLDANQSHVDVSSLTSTSVHLDLLSETRQSLHPRWRRCFDRLTAMARGHLTRRLMKTHRVRSIIQTIKDTLECALRLHGDPHIRCGLVTPQDVELHQRLITQLTAACYELHDVFFNIPIAERMQLIAQLRTHETRPVMSNRSSMDRGARKISSATQKVLERRISKLAGQDHQVQTKRPTAVVRAQTIVVTGPSDTCHTAGATAQPGTTRKICRLPMYKV
ncbi:uncharacterized protein LOC144101936 isoform X2 [Amblyomma americanum]